MSERAVVIGVGNCAAGDDAAGVLVARAVRARVGEAVEVLEHEGEPTALLDAWAGARLAVVVDATSGGGAAGTVRVADATLDPLPSPAFNGTSTHAFSLSAAIELARTLDRLPERLLVVGIEGCSFAVGAPPSAQMQAAVATSAARVLSLLDERGSPAV